MRIFTEEHKEKLRLSAIGNRNCVGRKLSNETKEKMRNSAKRRGTGKWNKGIKRSDEMRIKLSKAKKGKPQPWNSGVKHHNWKGGISSEVQKIRNSIEMRLWREAVFSRDSWICQECGIRGGNLEAHHCITRFVDIININNIKSIEDADDCEELWNINNGMTLCKKCHINTETYGNKKN